MSIFSQNYDEKQTPVPSPTSKRQDYYCQSFLFAAVDCRNVDIYMISGQTSFVIINAIKNFTCWIQNNY